MEELRFTWLSVLKIFAAVLILGVWFVARSQVKADHRHGREVRIVPRTCFYMVAAAILFLVIVLLWGNASTI